MKCPSILLEANHPTDDCSMANLKLWRIICLPNNAAGALCKILCRFNIILSTNHNCSSKILFGHHQNRHANCSNHASGSYLKSNSVEVGESNWGMEA